MSGNNANGLWDPADMEITLVASANHNVGIGTNFSTGNEDYSPSDRLEVNGNFQVGTNLGTTGFSEFRVVCPPAGASSDGGATASGGGYVVVGSQAGTGTIPTPTTTEGVKLLVNGSMVAKEVWTSNAWSDYVFDDGYKLMPLDELGKTLKATKHLPDMPTATEVAVHGFSVGDVESRLLKKVEELTIYVLQLHEENETLERQIEKFSKQ
ncbi:MAG: hypothetical protein ACRDF4_07325 [Rhabdochlamydiaceae bacterium]